ncbi:MAG: hypothetical protein N2322_00575 [Terrimicrobiaceae bacterium]|nr:hypothetical protein [Terrimicrobiaceae bacterium]
MNPILAGAGELQQFCAGQDWRFCFIGGLAAQRWGEPRNTLDADLTLLTGFGNEERFIDALLAAFDGRRTDTKDFALRFRVLLLRASNGTPLDVALGAMPFEENCVARSSPWHLPDGPALLTCSAEDLIVHKAFAGRDRDWLDIEGVLLVQRERLNLRQVREELEPLLALKEERESLRKLKSLCKKCGLEMD